MRHAKQIKKSTEAKVVVDKAVAVPTFSDYFRERYLKRGKHLLECDNNIIPNVSSPATDAAAQQAKRQKFFLHNSVSRWKPPQAKLDEWVNKFMQKPLLELRSGCIVTLAQPNTKRPACSFVNPTKPRGKHNYNDGLGITVIALLAAGKLPNNEFDEASHICGVARCFNAQHLVWEDIGTNSSRNLCHLYQQPCTHYPRCIVIDSDAKHQIQQHLVTK